jgi:hypothetical protein
MLQDFAATYRITNLSAFPRATPAEVMLEVYTYARSAPTRRTAGRSPRRDAHLDLLL